MSQPEQPQLFALDHTEVIKCLRILMNYLVDGTPWPGRPDKSATQVAIAGALGGKSKGEIFEAMAATLHLGVIGCALNDAMVPNLPAFRGDAVAQEIIEYAYTNPTRWVKVPGVGSLIRGVVELAFSVHARTE
jgi:hypothetical protein